MKKLRELTGTRIRAVSGDEAARHRGSCPRRVSPPLRGHVRPRHESLDVRRTLLPRIEVVADDGRTLTKRERDELIESAAES